MATEWDKWDKLEVSDDEDMYTQRDKMDEQTKQMTMPELRAKEWGGGLRMAVSYNEPSTIKHFIHELGDDVNGTDWGGNTALHTAVAEDKLQCLKLLLKEGE